jgi:26S proteasome regulatory subunit N1
VLVFFCLQAHLIDGRASAGASVDSARQNLAATFVNAFVNAGFGQVTHLSLCSVLGLVGIG